MINKTLNKNISKPSYSQSGFTLIELLLASTLGIFVIGGVIVSFMSTTASERMRSAISEMDANARTAMIILRQNIAHTGYGSTKNVLIDKPFYSETDGELVNPSCAGGIDMNTSGHTPGRRQYTRDSSSTGRGDVLTIISLADNPCLDLAGNATCPKANINTDALVYTDCAGGGSDRDQQAVNCSTDLMPDPREAKIYSTFYLGRGSSANKHTLFCRGNRVGTVSLVENIEYLQFLYGVTKDDGTTRYLNADEIEANANWGLVTSVQVGLLMRSSNEHLLKSDSDKEKYVLLDRKVKIKDKRRLYRIYTTTINLPNRDKGALL